MEVNNVANSTVNSTSSSSASDTILSKDDFLKLFLAQIKNQDPLNAMDPMEFTNQLALFNNVEQLQQMNEKFDSLIASQSTTQSAMAVSFIGKQVTADGDSVTVESGTSDYTLQYSLSEEATDVQILIKDSNGRVVAALDEGDQQAGKNSAQWDGKDSNGTTVAPGEYSFSVSAKNSKGNDVTAQTYTTGTVTGVSFDSGGILLNMNGKSVSFADVVSVMSDDTDGGSKS